MRRVGTWIVVASLVIPGRAGAQELEVVAGAAGGVAAGVVVTMGWLVARATFEEQYLHDASELVGLAGAPLLLGPAAGIGLALWDEDRLRGAGIGAGAGTLLGATVGVGLGELLAGDQTARWAGGVMGAAAGLLVGAVIGGLHDPDDEEAGPGTQTARIPVGISIRF
jgi:MFS family permease